MAEPQHTIGLMNTRVAGGLAVAAVAGGALFATRNLDAGTLAEIGPGLFPRALATILLILALVVTVTGIANIGDRERFAAWSARPIAFILGAVLLFGLSVRTLGIVMAAPAAILLSGMASSETRWLQLLMFAIALTAFCTVLFRYLLGLPIPVAPWLIGY